MTYTLREAAEAVGKGKPAILKAIQSGKISGVKDEHGEWQIEPAELHRVYPPVSETASETSSEKGQETIGNSSGNSHLQQELRFLREKLADLATVREDERRLLSDRIEELRRDRDDARGERDKLLRVIEEQAGSVRLLTTKERYCRRQLMEWARNRPGRPGRRFEAGCALLQPENRKPSVRASYARK